MFSRTFDPDNRLVADSLEAEWNQTLRTLAEVQDRCEKLRQADRVGLNDQQRANIMALAQDFPRLWNDPRTPDRERKRMVRLLIADVTLLKGADLQVQVRFNGGLTQTLHVPLPLPTWAVRQTPAATLAEIDRLLEDHTAGEVADLLNRKGLSSGQGLQFHRVMVVRICKAYALKTRYERLRARKLLTLGEVAQRLNVAPHTIKGWRRAGLLAAHRYNDKGAYLFEHPGVDAPAKHQRHQAKKCGRSAAYKQSVTPNYS